MAARLHRSRQPQHGIHVRGAKRPGTCELLSRPSHDSACEAQGQVPQPVDIEFDTISTGKDASRRRFGGGALEIALVRTGEIREPGQGVDAARRDAGDDGQQLVANAIACE